MVASLLWVITACSAAIWQWIDPIDPRAGIHAAPFFGRWAWHGTAWLAVAAACGAVAVAWGPALLDRVRERWVAPLAGAAASGWVIVVALGDGAGRLSSPLTGDHQYLPFARTISPARFVDTFIERARDYPTHVKGHPPGATLAVWAIDRIGFGNLTWSALVLIAAWGLGIAAVVRTVIELGGGAAGRRVAPFVVLVPSVVWAGTSVDALFFAVAAVGIWLVVGATRHRSWRAAALRSLAGGVVLGVALHLTYGAVPLLVIPVAVAATRRRVAPVAFAALGAAALTAAFAVAGFWWFDGLDATRVFYREGLADIRPYWFFVLAANLGVLAVGVGPASVRGIDEGLRAARRHPELVLAAAAIVAVLLADVSGMSKGEVERIWLPYVPWIAVATTAVPTSGRSRWLGAQVVLTLVLQMSLVTPW